MTETDLNPLFYVCVLSNFNLPQFEACLARRPSDLVLVVSDFKPARDGAENIQPLLEQTLPGIRVHRPDLYNPSPQLTGDDALNAQHWIAEVLAPYLEAYRGNKHCWLNLTGGTKATSLALITGYEWSGLDYKSSGHASIQSYQLRLGGLPNAQALCPDMAWELPGVSPQQVARIYNKAFQEKPWNPLRNNPGSLQLAKDLFAGLEQQDPGLVCIFEGFNRIWSEQRDKNLYPEWRIAQIKLPLEEFLGQPKDAWPDNLDYWLQRFQTLDESSFGVIDETVYFPGNSPKGHLKKRLKSFQNWLSGDWLEQLAGCWLVTSGIPPQNMAYGLKAGNQKNPANLREVDILIHHEGRTHIIEVKADIPSGTLAKEAERQLSSMNRAYGQSRRVLFIGPEFKNCLKISGDLEGFSMRCEDNGVTLSWDRKTLLSALKQK